MLTKQCQKPLVVTYLSYSYAVDLPHKFKGRVKTFSDLPLKFKGRRNV